MSLKVQQNSLCYEHYDCSPPIVHRGITTKNITLDLEYVADVSDFGSTKLLFPNSSNWSSFVGTLDFGTTKLLCSNSSSWSSFVGTFGYAARG